MVEVSASCSCLSARKLATVEPSSRAERKRCSRPRRSETAAAATRRRPDADRRADVARPDDLGPGRRGREFGRRVEPGKTHHRRHISRWRAAASRGAWTDWRSRRLKSCDFKHAVHYRAPLRQREAARPSRSSHCAPAIDARGGGRKSAAPNRQAPASPLNRRIARLWPRRGGFARGGTASNERADDEARDRALHFVAPRLAAAALAFSPNSSPWPSTIRPARHDLAAVAAELKATFGDRVLCAQSDDPSAPDARPIGWLRRRLPALRRPHAALLEAPPPALPERLARRGPPPTRRDLGRRAPARSASRSPEPRLCSPDVKSARAVAAPKRFPRFRRISCSATCEAPRAPYSALPRPQAIPRLRPRRLRRSHLSRTLGIDDPGVGDELALPTLTFCRRIRRIAGIRRDLQLHQDDLPRLRPVVRDGPTWLRPGGYGWGDSTPKPNTISSAFPSTSSWPRSASTSTGQTRARQADATLQHLLAGARRRQRLRRPAEEPEHPAPARRHRRAQRDCPAKAGHGNQNPTTQLGLHRPIQPALLQFARRPRSTTTSSGI